MNNKKYDESKAKEENIMNEIKTTINNTNEDNVNKINWTKVWSKKYPVLNTYQEQVNIEKYAKEIRRLLAQLEQDYNYSELDAMLVLKDILANVWKNRKSI